MLELRSVWFVHNIDQQYYSYGQSDMATNCPFGRLLGVQQAITLYPAVQRNDLNMGKAIVSIKFYCWISHLKYDHFYDF